MKRIILPFTILVALVILPFALANPILPGYINELFFTSGKWVLEIDTHIMQEGNLDGWTLSSRAGTAAFKPGIDASSGLVLVTPDSLLTPLSIDPAGDSVTVKTKNVSMSVIFGSGSQCWLRAPAAGSSISFNGSFFTLDQSPTIGAANDTAGALATVLGVVRDADTQVPVSISQIWDMSDEYRGWVTLRDSGRFTARLYSHNFTLAAFATGYQSGSVHLSLSPGQVVDTVILMQKLDSVPGEETPRVSALYQNYPNPFNPSTTLVFDLPTAGKVTLQIYDALGREVAELVRGFRPSGQYRVTWDGKDETGAPMASGVYLARLELIGMGGEMSAQKAIKLLLVR